jgi:uncharacterized peroxidase-related enzyme
VRALCDFAVKLTHASASIVQADVEGLRVHGWSDADIHDAIQVIAYFNYINRVADAVGIEDEPDWSSPSPTSMPSAATEKSRSSPSG